MPDVYRSTSGDVILMVLVGGVGTIFGPVVGAFTVVGMQTILRQFGAWVNVIQGVVFVALRAVAAARASSARVMRLTGRPL